MSSSDQVTTPHVPALVDTDDRPTLEALRSYEDPRSGIRERFLTPTIGAGRTVAVLATPIGDIGSIGWIVCHSFGQDQINLQPFEVPMARRLAASGHPVLRFHVQGYGDSELPPEHISLRSHVDETIEAARLLASTAGVARVGLVGARFGGAVAALAADELEASALVMWEPMVKGRAHMQALVRLGVMTELVNRTRTQASARDPMEVLKEDGVLDVQGFPLRREVFEEVSNANLLTELTRFRGRSLVVQVSRSSTQRPALVQLVERLRELGGDSRLEVITNGKADKFGQPRFMGRGDGTKADTQSSLADGLASATVSWAGASAEGPDS